MDANNTRYHLLLGQADWFTCKTDLLPVALPPDPVPPAPVVVMGEQWRVPAARQRLAVDWEDRRAQLTLKPLPFPFPTAPGDRAPQIDNRRGAARDRYGNWYWIDSAQTAIRVRSSGTETVTLFWATNSLTQAPSLRPGDFQPVSTATGSGPVQLGGLAVTEDHYLVVGTVQPAGLFIFDLHAGGPPQQLLWPSQVAFTPFDMTPRPGGGVWILDRVHHCYWAIDRNFTVISADQATLTLRAQRQDDFQPKAPADNPASNRSPRQSPARPFPTGIHGIAPAALADLDPLAIEALPDGTVLILENPAGARFARIHRYRFGTRLGDPVSTEISCDPRTKTADCRLLAHDFAFVPEHADPLDASQVIPDRLYVAADSGNQSYAFVLKTAVGAPEQIVLEAKPEYWPMRLFGGRALVASGGQVYYDFGADASTRWLPLVEQRRPRYTEQATLYTRVFDGREPDCVWHRLLLDASIPAETQVLVYSRTENRDFSNDHTEQTTSWEPEPTFYRRGDASELPFVRNTANHPAARPSNSMDTWELLFQRARGQFLQLKLVVQGDGRSTPRLRALRAYYPRFAYTTYLPAAYREPAPLLDLYGIDPCTADNLGALDTEQRRQMEASFSFLERFLANFEGIYTALEDKIAAVQLLFDVRSSPSEALEWLASWFGVVLDPVWDAARRRLFIQHAMTFFHFRGTAFGLKMALRLALDAQVDATIFALQPAEPLARQRANAIRIREQFRARPRPAPPASNVLNQRWQPAQGGAALSLRYTSLLQQNLAGVAFTPFPIQPPAGAEGELWAKFVLATLGFRPAAQATDLRQWQLYLARRYPSLAAFNQAYGLSTSGKPLSSFSQIPLPSALPADGAPLRDWVHFEAAVLPLQRTAHHFTVQLPVIVSGQVNDVAFQERLALAKRIITLEKPAHTTFDIQYYWAMFRVGDARLGEDTLIGQGSRAPQLLPPMVLGQGYLVESTLVAGHPQNGSERMLVVGRDVVKI